ncbi:Nn.00g050850.m01.CDS01 [Neocucurbitaria sp. VM-36]
MPVSHIGLTVSHLPTSTSFFLAALQPLGYRYIGQSGNQIGLGIRDADFFLCQETPGVKAGAAHIAFTAPSTTAVRNFYTAALTAGGRPNGAPATRCEEDGHFNAAVLDFDGNSIEVVFRNEPDIRDDGTVIEHSRVITWQRTVAESYRDDRSVVSARTSASKAAATEVMSQAPTVVSKAPSAASKPGSMARSVSEPTTIPQTATTSDSGDRAAKKIIGTLLGAAAGAAVAYAMVRSEQDSAKKEADFSAFMEAKATVKAAVGHLAQASSQPTQPMQVQDPQPTYETAPPPQSVHRNIDAQSYHSATPSRAGSVSAQRQIEAAPASYYSPSHVSVSRTQITEPRVIEYAPAYSVAPSQARSRLSVQRSMTSPEMLTIEKARSVASTSKPQSVMSVSKPQSVVHSVAPSSLISSFVPDVPRRSSEGSVHSQHSSRSKAKSSHTHASRHTSHSRSSRKEVDESSPSPPAPASKAPSKVASKAASLVGSILGRDTKSTASKHDDFIDDFEIEELTEDDIDTVVPSDSISNAGSSSRRSHRSHRSHRSKKHDDESVVSKQSSSSKHSKRSHRSHKTRSHHDSDDSADEYEKRKRSSRPSVVSEPSDASTVKPIKPASKVGSRKDSVTSGQYEGLFDEVQYGTGSVATMPIRGITPSMISAAGKNKNKGVVNYAHAQRMRAFEGQ